MEAEEKAYELRVRRLAEKLGYKLQKKRGYLYGLLDTRGLWIAGQSWGGTLQEIEDLLNWIESERKKNKEKKNG